MDTIYKRNFFGDKNWNSRERLDVIFWSDHWVYWWRGKSHVISAQHFPRHSGNNFSEKNLWWQKLLSWIGVNLIADKHISSMLSYSSRNFSLSCTWYKLYPYSGRHFNTAGPSDFLKVNFQTPQIKRKLFCYRLYSIVDNCKIRGHFNTPWPCDRSISTCLRDSERS